MNAYTITAYAGRTTKDRYSAGSIDAARSLSRELTRVAFSIQVFEGDDLMASWEKGRGWKTFASKTCKDCGLSIDDTADLGGCYCF